MRLWDAFLVVHPITDNVKINNMARLVKNGGMQMEREYKLSRIIIAILMMMVSFIMLINEDISVKIFGMSFFTSVAFLASFLGTRVSRKMIQVGDKIENIPFRILYYIVLLIALLAAGYAICSIILLIFEAMPHSNELGIAAGEAMFAVLIGFSFLVFVIIPYFQTLIVLGLRKIIIKKEK